MNSFRKKHRPVPVSFFAFQDIITALAGCMLIFVLSSIAAKTNSASVEDGGLIDSKEYDLLQNQIKLNNSLLAKEEQAIAVLEQEFDRSKLAEQTQKHNKNLALSRRKLEKVARERARLFDEIRRSLELEQKLNRTLAEKNPQLAALINQADKLQQEYAMQQSKLLFADSKKKNLILTVSRKCWLWQAVPGKTPELLGNSVEAPEKVLQKLYDCKSSEVRLIIAVRPSGGGFIEQLKKLLKHTFPAMEIVAEPLASENSGGLEL